MTRRIIPEINEIVDLWADLESACCLAQIADREGACAPRAIERALFSCKQCGSFLLADNCGVRNSIANLENEARVLLLTGSNMSGKSTLLRTLFHNMVVANAGAYVLATEFIYRPSPLLCCFTPQDDLRAGVSRFAAEVRDLVSAMDFIRGGRGSPSYLFADEPLSGTNNTERGIALPRLLFSFASSGCTVLATTHDERVIDEIHESSYGKIFHMFTSLQDGKMRYEFFAKTGVDRSKNAIAILEQAGLLRYD